MNCISQEDNSLGENIHTNCFSRGRRPYSANHACIEAEFLDEIQTKVIHSHLYSFAFRFLFLQTQTTYSSF